MSEVLSELQWLPPLIDTILTLLAAAFVLIRYRLNRLRQSLFWGLGLIALGISFLMKVGFHYSLIPRTGLSLLAAETLTALMFVLIYYGCAITVTKNRKYTTLLPALVFVIEQSFFGYFAVMTEEYVVVGIITAFSFFIPFYVFFGYIFVIDYMSLKRISSLLIAISWRMSAAVQPLFILWLFSPLESIHHILRTGSTAIMFIGFVQLAHSKVKKPQLGSYTSQRDRVIHPERSNISKCLAF